MRSINDLIDVLTGFLPGFVNDGGCICDALNRMHYNGQITFAEMQTLENFINLKISVLFLDNVIETGNYQLFTLKLNSLK